jgi:hypothetical protein
MIVTYVMQGGLHNFSFLEKWIFEGSCQDAYTEFFIQEQPDLMTCRQRDYWSRGYYMLEEAIPGFLKGLEVPIFHCGKALNLLKLCNPQVRAVLNCRHLIFDVWVLCQIWLQWYR